MDERYQALVAIMEDPENLACMCREFYRKWGEWPSVSSLIARPWIGNELHALDMSILAEIKATATFWVIVHSGDEEMELGPFQDIRSARDQAEMFLLSEGSIVHALRDLPWNEEDEREFPLPARSYK